MNYGLKSLSNRPPSLCAQVPDEYRQILQMNLKANIKKNGFAVVGLAEYVKGLRKA